MGDRAIIRTKGKDINLKKNTRESKQLKVMLCKKEEKVVDNYYEYSGTLQISGKKIKVTYKVRGEGGMLEIESQIIDIEFETIDLEELAVRINLKERTIKNLSIIKKKKFNR